MGYENITVTWDMRRSGNTPEDFTLAYSLDGVNFTNAHSFVTSNTAWSTTTRETLKTSFTKNLGSVAELANAPVFYLRLVNGTWSTSSYIEFDNFTITGDAIPETPETPETPVTPLPLAVLGGGALLGMVGLGRGGRQRGGRGRG